MAKKSGLGSALFVHGYDLSDDGQSIAQCGCPRATQDMTGLRKRGMQRKELLRDGVFNWVGFWNADVGAANDVLANPTLPDTDQIVTWCPVGELIGNPALCQTSLVLDYAPTRAQSGELTIAVNSTANGFGQEWCDLLTAGARVDGGATNGASLDTAASVSFGLQAYLHVLEFTGTSAAIAVQDSADNVSFANLTGGSFVSVTAAPGAQRIQTGRTQTVRRYLRVATTGVFTNLKFLVAVQKNVITTAF